MRIVIQDTQRIAIRRMATKTAQMLFLMREFHIRIVVELHLMEPDVRRNPRGWHWRLLFLRKSMFFGHNNLLKNGGRKAKRLASLFLPHPPR